MMKTVLHSVLPTFVLCALAICTLVLCALLAPAFAAWRDQVTDYDSGRLAHLEDARLAALHEAETRRGTGDFRILRETVTAESRSVPERALMGRWRCRQMKLGGMTGYEVYSWFPCTISRVNGGIWFEKQGTQRMAGYLYPDDKGLWVYLGAQSAKGEPFHRYSGQAAFAGEDVALDDQVGALVGIGNNRLRIDLPSPATRESDFDVIELTR
jgi:hypothetical protein